MADDAELNALLDLDADDVRETPPQPSGWYAYEVTNFEEGESREKQTPYRRYTLSGATPFSEVDDEEWADFNVDGDSTQEVDFWITKKALFRLKEFIIACGVEITGRKMVKLIPLPVGHKVLAHITHSVGKNRDGKTVRYANVTDFKKFE